MSFVIDCGEEEFATAGAVEKALEGCVETDATLVIELSFVDGEEIRRLNRELRSTDRVTDVLSFPALDILAGQAVKAAEHPFETDEEGRLLLGSVAICVERAKEQAEEYGHSFERELHYLLVHGVMHCLGYDHEMDEERAEMREKEESVMQKMGITRKR
jgi:probable rRNA maturation factor